MISFFPKISLLRATCAKESNIFVTSITYAVMLCAVIKKFLSLTDGSHSIISTVTFAAEFWLIAGVWKFITYYTKVKEKKFITVTLAENILARRQSIAVSVHGVQEKLQYRLTDYFEKFM
uniref:Uncharacterized protein n=1 Tax=Glossina morsitans morsitans TaxID=37546 RepID=A0A1B0GCC9_GLOMM